MLYTFDTCADFIRTLPALQHDTTRPEDIDSDAEDHAADEARYGVMSRPWTRAPTVVRPFRGTDQMTFAEASKLANPRTRVGAQIRI